MSAMRFSSVLLFLDLGIGPLHSQVSEVQCICSRPPETEVKNKITIINCVLYCDAWVYTLPLTLSLYTELC